MKMTPILVIYFNRPRYLKMLLLALKKFEPKDIYFSCDGPRIDNFLDSINIKKCNEIIEKIVDWDCKKRFLQSKKNLGCDEWVPKSISWFFSQETKGIILEDDCIIDDGFYNFASELLEKYLNNTEIMNISASSFQKETSRDSADYHFSCYPLTWGWATWRRAWIHYQSIVNQQTYNDEIKGWLILNGFSKEEVKYWSKFFSRLEQDSVAFWDAKWIYSVWLRNAYSITPNQNLVKNIGYGSDATHTKSLFDLPHLRLNKIKIPLSHPGSNHIAVDKDRKTFHRKFKFTAKKKFLYILSLLLGSH
jgi:hypothetical protein